MKFLPGEHFLDSELFVYAVNQFTMSGTEGNKSFVVINLRNNVTIVKSSVVEIHSLSFTGLPKSVLFVVNAIDVYFYDLIITNCSGSFTFGRIPSRAFVIDLEVKEKDISDDLLVFSYVEQLILANNNFSGNFFSDRGAALIGIWQSPTVFISGNVLTNNTGYDHGFVLILIAKSEVS